MKSKIKSWAKSFLQSCGLDVRFAATHNAYSVQKTLLSKTTVRTVVDAGGYQGEWTAAYRKAFPAARVIVFEPFPSSFDRLRKQFAADSQVTVVDRALGEVDGTRTLYCNHLPATNSLLPADSSIRELLPNPDWVKPDSELVTKVISLDNYCSAAKIDHIHVLKMDIQGAELMALHGAARLLSRGAVDLIYTEILFHPHYHGQAQHFEIAAYLHQNGYGLYGLYNLGVGRTGRMFQADAIFVHPRLNGQTDRQGAPH